MPSTSNPTYKRKYSFKSSGELGDIENKVITSARTPLPISIKTPIRLGVNRTGIFDMYTDPRKSLRDNLKNLILTNKGERLGRADIGASLRTLTTERVSRDTFDAEAMLRISNAVTVAMPFIELEDYSSEFELDDTDSVKSMSKIVITLVYNVPQLRIIKDRLQVIINTIG